MLGFMGVVAGAALLIVLALRGVSVIVASILCGLVIAVANMRSPVTAIMTDYSQAAFSFAGTFFVLFVSGAIFGRVMSESHAAAAIAYALGRRLGPERTLWIGMLIAALLTYGGVNVFIVIFTVYPLGLGLMQQSNTPKRLFMAATSLGAGTFTMTAMPGSPSVHNVIMAKALGTPLTAGASIGLAASAIMIVLGMAYLERARRHAKTAGEGFVAAPTDVFPAEPDAAKMPHWGVASLPMALVLGIILLPQWLGAWWPPAADSGRPYAVIMRLAAENPLGWTCVAMVAGGLAGFALFRRHLPDSFGVMGRGAENAVLPLINTAVVIGFGGVVRATPVFTDFAHVLLDTGIPPLISAALAINVIAGIVGSASGALGIFTGTLSEHYLQAGVPAEVLHRVVAIGSGGLDSLPHCGAIITMLTIMGLTHKEAYKDVAVVTVIIPLIALVLIVAAITIGA